ncbi:MAG: twin-arginine translocase subunit TatC [Pirellulales bacterium]|nr:twin-arginine translocase subunit TatC [Pirellulales bacterium]
MPRRKPDEDLFAESTMTFGEHLEELRGCLIRSLVVLVFGFLIGMYFGSDVVSFIQTPLDSALASHVEAQEEKKAVERFDAIEAEGETLPIDSFMLKALVTREHLIPQEYYVDPEAVLQQLKDRYPEKFRDVQLPAMDIVKPVNSDEPTDAELDKAAQIARAALIRVLLFRPVEDDPRTRASGLSVHEAFSIWVKASLLLGALLASPYIFYEIWTFVAAGLYPHEKRYIHIYLPFSLGLFFLGAAMAFFFVFEPVLSFLFSFNAALGIDITPRISEWLGFVIILPLGFGISFQMPLVMLFLERIGVLSVEAYKSKLRIAILVIFIISMFLTPADPTSMFLMAIPLTVLYFVGILLCKLMPRRRSPFAEES